MPDKEKTVSFRTTEELFKALREQHEEDDWRSSEWGRASARAYIRNPQTYRFIISLLEKQDLEPEEISPKENRNFGLEPEEYDSLVELVGDYFNTLLREEESYQEAMEIGQEIRDFDKELGELVARTTVYLEELYTDIE